MRSIALVGNPNVGKSVLFNNLTGSYATVSNYPGTTVEITRGRAGFPGVVSWVYDTPGMYSLSPLTEEEAVTGRFLREKSPDLIIHVADAKNLRRMLPLTLELLSLDIPVILVLNMMDEAKRLGVKIDRAALSERLGIPVLAAALTRGSGLAALKKTISRQWQSGGPRQKKVQPDAAEYRKTLDLHTLRRSPIDLRQQAADLLRDIYSPGEENGGGWLERLSLHPWGGFLLTLFILYAGLYLAVGQIGAGYLVDLLEGTILGQVLIPPLSRLIAALVPWPAWQSLFIGEYGLLTFGLRYAFGIILPIVGTYFFVFAFLEDTGYLPRLAFWTDWALKKIGLSGRAVIPLTLGLGCGTMAVLVTRTLEQKRERIIASFLLALAVPCSAQLGLMLALLSGEPQYLLIWLLMIGSVFLLAGRAADAFLPGEKASFFMELPPLRRPELWAVGKKTLARMRWYFLEIIPVFLIVSVLLWALDRTGALSRLGDYLAPLLGLMGLPPQLSLVFILGFFRRDYGAAGLFDLYRSGALSGALLLVASVVLTLFLPCLAQLVMMVKERGWPVSLAILGFVALIAFCAGVVLRFALGLPAF